MPFILYIILLSPPSVPGQVSGVSAVALSPFTVSVSWTPPNALGTVISQYTISYFNTTCPLFENFHTDSVTVSPPSTSTQLTLQSGQLYNISVKGSSVLGESTTVNISFRTPSTKGEVTGCIDTPLLLIHSAIVIV